MMQVPKPRKRYFDNENKKQIGTSSKRALKHCPYTALMHSRPQLQVKYSPLKQNANSAVQR